MVKIPENWAGVAIVAAVVVLIAETMRAPGPKLADGTTANAPGKITVPFLNVQVPSVLYFPPKAAQ